MSEFPDRFTWGVATSAYQIEGGIEDGKGESIWDRFAVEGRMSDTGAVACDHYHRFPEDVELMRRLGVDAYRFSLAWTRILPEGVGSVNQRGLDLYRRLVDELLEAGITPWATLYHWDLPQTLQDRGGWPDRSTVDAFVEYTAVVMDALGDRVDHWITHNEPWVASMLGYREGVFAPGVSNWPDALATAHHLLVSHGHAVDVIRNEVPGATVGIALDCRPAQPASNDPADVAAHRHFDGFRNRWFFDPVFGMGYPSDVMETYEVLGRFDSSVVRDGDMDVIARPIDFVGINYYTSLVIAAGGEESEDPGVPAGAPAQPGHTEMGWATTPDAFRDYLMHIHERYEPASIVITENGASYSTGPDADGLVDDADRVAYLEAHVAAVAEAIAAGAPVDGYFVWSLLDNLEWTSGFSQRFGLVWVDHNTQQRIPKSSYRWYRDFIAGTRMA